MERLVCGRLWWETTASPTPQWCLALGDPGTRTQTLDTPSPSPPQDATAEQLRGNDIQIMLADHGGFATH
jgi:hypothetical protein